MKFVHRQNDPKRDLLIKLKIYYQIKEWLPITNKCTQKN